MPSPARLQARVAAGVSYDVQIGGEAYDRKLLLGFLKSGPTLSHSEICSLVLPDLADGGRVTQRELNTVVFALQHSKLGSKAARDALLPFLQGKFPDSAVSLIAPGQLGFGFDALVARLQRKGRVSDLYAAKSAMTPAELESMWTTGISIETFHMRLKSGLSPKSKAEIVAHFSSETVASTKAWLQETGNANAIAKLDSGRMSFGEFQNLVYGQWEAEDPQVRGRTPYNAKYDAKYQATV